MRHTHHTAERAAIDVMHCLGIPPNADLPRLTNHITTTAAYLDTQGGSAHTKAVRIIDVATRIAEAVPDQEATSAAVDHFEQCLHTVGGVRAPITTQALALLDSVLDDLVQIFDLTDYRRQPAPQFALARPGSL